MKKIKYACTVLLPNLIIIIYLLCFNWAEAYDSNHFTIGTKIIVQIIGNILFGVFLFFICKESLCNKESNIAGKYILSIIIIPLIYLLAFIPVLNLSFIHFYVFDIIPYYIIFASIYIGISLYQKRKK